MTKNTNVKYEDVENWLGQDDAIENAIEALVDIANGKYKPSLFKKEVLMLKDQPDYSCSVCQKGFDDTWEHILNNGGVGCFLGYNKVHAKYGHAIEQSNYEKPCFCGGHITINGTGQDSWETTCDNCGFLFDED